MTKYLQLTENLCTRGWNGHRVRVQLSALEKSGHLRTVEGPMESHGILDAARTPSVPQQALQSGAVTTHSASYVFRPMISEALAKSRVDILYMPARLTR